MSAMAPTLHADARRTVTPFVGRAAEVRILQECAERLLSGTGGIVTIVGEAGLGKSRLAGELRSWMQARGAFAGARWVEGRCLSYGSSIAYLLWLDVLHALLGLAPGGTAPAVEAARRAVAAACPQDAERIFPYLARLLAPPAGAGDAPACDLEGEALQGAIFRAMETLFAGAALRGPLVVVCEDLHWGDPTSVDLLEHLLDLTGRVPVLLVCLFRPEAHGGCWRLRETAVRNHRERYRHLWLTPLSAAEMETLIGHLLDVPGTPAPVRARVAGRAAGNPFYAEELARALAAGGPDTGDSRALSNAAGSAIPDTLQGILTARIGRLQEETRRILQLAAVAGPVCVLPVLAAMTREGRDLQQHLLVLQREDLLRPQARGPEIEYVFGHYLLQEAAYNGLLRPERRRLHRQVAETLERFFAERAEDQPGLLAYHWERAEEPGRAIACLLRAGDRARQVYAHEEALDFYRRGVALLEQEGRFERAARTLMKMGLVHHSAFEFWQAREAYERGAVLARRAATAARGAPPRPAPHALRLWQPVAPTNLDPQWAWDTHTTGAIKQLFSSVVELDPNLDIAPGCAHSWEVLDDGCRYVFHLRADVRWSDGTPLTAGDFEFAWKRLAGLQAITATGYLLHDVKGARALHRGESVDPDTVAVRAIDAYTLEVELEAPTAYFLQLVAFTPASPVPRHMVRAHGLNWASADRIVTNGPFRLEAWRPGGPLTLARDPGFYGQATGNVQRVELSWGGDSQAALAAYAAGDLDVLHLLPADVDRARRQHAGDYFSAPALHTLYLGFDLTRPPFDDARARWAFALAADPETLADKVLRGHSFPATGGFIPPDVPGHAAGIALRHDPEQARAFLAEAGYPGGRGLPAVGLLASRGREHECAYLCDQWSRHLGVSVAFETPDWETFQRRLNADPPPPLFLYGWVADYPDPDNCLRLSPVCRRAAWCNPTFAGLVEAARHVANRADRLRMYQEADRLLIDDAVVVPLAYGRLHFLVKPWVTRYPTAPAKLWFWKDVVVEPHRVAGAGS